MYPGDKSSMYKDCAQIPDVSLKMWMSCCDQTCSGLGSPAGDVNENALRSVPPSFPLNVRIESMI